MEPMDTSALVAAVSRLLGAHGQLDDPRWEDLAGALRRLHGAGCTTTAIGQAARNPWWAIGAPSGRC